MRKTHWESINKSSLMLEALIRVSTAVKARAGVHEHASDFLHIDCVQDHISPLLPKEWSPLDKAKPTALLRQLLIYYIFIRDGQKVYRMAKDFTAELKNTKINVPARVIPADNKIICIEFPEGFKYACVYIACVESPGTDTRGPVYKRIEFRFCDPLTSMDAWDGYLCHFYDENENIDDSVRLLHSDLVPDEYLKFALNCFLYIHSGKPDLREYLPPQKPLSRKPKVQRRFEKEMQETDGIPVTLVGYSFKKETQVGAHMQRYWTGKGRTDLMWVYKNAYKKGINEDSI